jgi:hypothetical protein
MKWKNHTYDCANPVGALHNPAVDTAGFCHRFQQVVDFLWQQFTTFTTTDKCHELPRDSDRYNQCVVASIIGFTIQASCPAHPTTQCIPTGFNPDACECPNLDPGKCPKQCTDEVQRTESAQALLRGVPWTGYGDPATCAKCPSLVEADCPRIACVAPQTRDISPDAKQYHFDKFLHFWAPYGGAGSAYNLDPFARFIHNKDEGVDALSAYGFSIDDFYGFFGGHGTTLVVDVGGKSALDNKEPRDPFTQYFANLGPGWDRVRVCGREFPVTDPLAGPAFPISFWQKEGDVYRHHPVCEVVAFASNNDYVKFQVREIKRDLVDTYTNVRHRDIPGLVGAYAAGEGMFAVRGANPPPTPADAYCVAHSSPAFVADGRCNANLSPHGNNQAYVGVPECASGLASADHVCGRPLMNVNIPGGFVGPGGGVGGGVPPGLSFGEIRSGTANGVGVAAAGGSGRGSLKLSGVFSFDGRLDLGAPGAQVTILNGLYAGESGGELVPGSLLTLAAEGRNTAKTARFKTARGETPQVEVTIGSKGRGQFTLLLDVSRAAIDVPGACPRPALATTIRVDDGTNPPLLVAINEPWECRTRGAKVEYLKAP